MKRNLHMNLSNKVGWAFLEHHWLSSKITFAGSSPLHSVILHLESDPEGISISANRDLYKRIFYIVLLFQTGSNINVK
jgi:hypothetical protein